MTLIKQVLCASVAGVFVSDQCHQGESVVSLGFLGKAEDLWRKWEGCIWIGNDVRQSRFAIVVEAARSSYCLGLLDREGNPS